MSSPGDRLRDWIDGLGEAWKDRLRGWMASWLSRGFTELIEILEPEAIDMFQAQFNKLRDAPDTPQDIKDLLNKLTAGTQPLPLLIAIPLGLAMLIPTATSIARPLGDVLEYHQQKVFHSFRLDPMSVITAWRRDPSAYEQYFDDLKDQGWTDERIEALKFFTLFYPSANDLVNWQAKEVFEPAMVSKYGLRDELAGLQRDAFYKAGMSDEQIDNFWMAHWQHPQLNTIIQMLRRTDFTENDMRAWFRLVEIPPYWRDKLIEISYEVPTRVDVRRFWDMRTIDEARLREIYAWQGYHGKDLDDYVLWTKVYTAFPDLIARWKNGWITLDNVRSELTGYGMPSARVEELIETKLKSTAGDRTAAERDLTKTDIYKGVKTGVITRGEGMELLMDLGFEEDEADYLLTINISPDEEEVVVQERELTKADILNGLKAEVITELEARDRLLELRYTGIDADILLDIYRANIQPPPEAREREASKADIVLAVKKGLITPEEAYLMLQDLGFTPEASQFILMVKAEVSPFSPHSYQEFKEETAKWRKAAGMVSSPEAEKLRQAAAEVVKFTRDIKALQRSIKEAEAKLVDQPVLPPEATARRDDLRVKLHRAESSLAAAKDNYDRLLAEWRNKE